MKKFFFFAAALVASVTLSAQTIEVCALDSAKASTFEIVAGKSADGPQIAAQTKFYEGTAMDVILPFATKMAVVSATQPNGAHKKVQIGTTEINMAQAIQGNDNPKDVDGKAPATSLLVPTEGALWQIDAKTNGYIVVLHKASSNKQYFVFENGTALGYSFGMMTYAPDTVTPLGQNGLLQYTLTGDAEYNYLTADNLAASTGFNSIGWVEDYFNDTLTSGIAWRTYKQNGVSAIAFNAYAGCHYLVGAAGSKISAAAIVFVSDLTADLPIVAKGETITEEGKDPVTYNDVTLCTLALGSAINNVEGAVKAQKVIRNGQVLIIKNGVAYTVLGTVAE